MKGPETKSRKPELKNGNASAKREGHGETRKPNRRTELILENGIGDPEQPQAASVERKANGETGLANGETRELGTESRELTGKRKWQTGKWENRSCGTGYPS